MVNINNFGNSTQFNLNMSMINDSSTMLPNLISNANDVTQNYFGLGVMIVIFIALIVVTYKETGDIRLDGARSMLVASGITFIIGLLALYSGIFYSFQHVGWFFLIFLLNLMFVYVQKKKQQ